MAPSTSNFPAGGVDVLSGGIPEYDDAIAAVQTTVLGMNGTAPGVVNALGVVGATCQLKPGFNTFTTGAANVTASFPATPTVGMTCQIEVTQGGTARTLTLSPVCIAAGGTAPALTASAAAVDFFSFKWDGAHWVMTESAKALA